MDQFCIILITFAMVSSQVCQLKGQEPGFVPSKESMLTSRWLLYNGARWDQIFSSKMIVLLAKRVVNHCCKSPPDFGLWLQLSFSLLVKTFSWHTLHINPHSPPCPCLLKPLVIISCVLDSWGCGLHASAWVGVWMGNDRGSGGAAVLSLHYQEQHLARESTSTQCGRKNSSEHDNRGPDRVRVAEGKNTENWSCSLLLLQRGVYFTQLPQTNFR